MEVGSSDARDLPEPEYPIASAGSVVTRRMHSEAQVELPGGGLVGPFKVRNCHADKPNPIAGEDGPHETDAGLAQGS